MTNTPDTLPEWTYLSFDWAQAELYLLSLFSKDAKLKAALLSKDVHKSTIAFMYGIDPDTVTEKQRDLAKVINYALPYSGFDFDSTVSNIVKKAPGTTNDQAFAALTRYVEEFRTLFDWSTEALYDWYDSGGWVSYFFGQRKRIFFPDYLKREESSLRRSQSGRVALNTYGQNSVGLLLKFVLANIRQDASLAGLTKQHLPLFDAHTCLVKTEHLAAVQAKLNYYATPILRLNGFEVQMKADWKASFSSWGELQKIPAPAPAAEPMVYAWDAAPLAPPREEPVLPDNPFNPFVTN